MIRSKGFRSKAFTNPYRSLDIINPIIDPLNDGTGGLYLGNLTGA